MCVVCVAVLLTACVLAGAQIPPTFDLHGNLQLVDLPQRATPVDAYLIGLHPQKGGFDIQVQPDHDGRFVVKNLRSGRYALRLPMPGRIVTFARGGQNLSPDGFRLVAAGRFIALLAPADRRLTLQFSCYSHPPNGPETEFRHVPPGRYRVFIIDARFQSEVAAYAPRFPDFLKKQARPVEVLSEAETRTTAAYVNDRTIQEAIQQIGPIH